KASRVQSWLHSRRCLLVACSTYAERGAGDKRLGSVGRDGHWLPVLTLTVMLPDAGLALVDHGWWWRPISQSGQVGQGGGQALGSHQAGCADGFGAGDTR